MSDWRPYDPERDGPLLSGYVDGELEPADRDLVEHWLANDSRVRDEVDRLVRLKAFTDHLQLREAPSEAWDEVRDSVYNRSERGFGWVLFWLGVAVIGGYLALRVVLMLAATTLPLLVRAGGLLAVVGLLILVVTALRERLFKKKRDRYDDVVR